jgi:hypothetical protein
MYRRAVACARENDDTRGACASHSRRVATRRSRHAARNSTRGTFSSARGGIVPDHDRSIGGITRHQCITFQKPMFKPSDRQPVWRARHTPSRRRDARWGSKDFPQSSNRGARARTSNATRTRARRLMRTRGCIKDVTLWRKTSPRGTRGGAREGKTRRT